MAAKEGGETGRERERAEREERDRERERREREREREGEREGWREGDREREGQRKLWPARPKLWLAQLGKHSIMSTYDPRLSDKCGGPAPPCDGHIRLHTQRTSSRLAALCANPAQSVGAVFTS